MPSRSHSRALVRLALLTALLNAAATAVSASEGIARVAVFPVENLSAGRIPASEIRKFLIDRLVSQGVGVLRDDALDEFIVRHRVRYAAGIDATTAEALRTETGVQGVLIASVEMSSDAVPPKIAIVVRLVSIEAAPVVVWADDAGLAGDDAPGFFELGIVNDYLTLQARALDRVSNSLLAYLKAGDPRTAVRRDRKFRPKTFYRALELEPGRVYSVAVVPFFNFSQQRNAGDILALLFLRHLCGFPEFRVIDPGVTRQQLLDARIIMDGGLSIADAETIAALIDADFVLGGRVLRYDDYEGAGGSTRAEFSTLLIEKKSRRVVWSSDSYNEGSDGVRFFERGFSKTAHVMATQMVRLTTEMIAGRDR